MGACGFGKGIIQNFGGISRNFEGIIRDFERNFYFGKGNYKQSQAYHFIFFHAPILPWGVKKGSTGGMIQLVDQPILKK
jgi:hypothetical protein